MKDEKEPSDDKYYSLEIQNYVNKQKAELIGKFLKSFNRVWDKVRKLNIENELSVEKHFKYNDPFDIEIKEWSKRRERPDGGK